MRSFLFKILYFLGVHFIFHKRIRKEEVLVLCLHEVSDERSLMYPPLTTETFQKLLSYILKYFEVVSFNDVLAQRESQYKKPRIILSFDDGHRSFYENVLPVLQQNKIKMNQNIVVDCAAGATEIWTDTFNNIIEVLSKRDKVDLNFNDTQYVFGREYNNLKEGVALFKSLLAVSEKVRADYIRTLKQNYNIDDNMAYMDWEQINICSQFNVEIGSHSKSHQALSVETNPAVLEREVSLSKELIEQHINKEVCIFSLPNGRQSKSVNHLVKEAGYQFMLTTEPKFWNTKDSTFIVPRIPLSGKKFYESVFEMYNFHSLLKKDRYN